MLELIKSKVFLWVLFVFIVVLAGAVVYTHIYTKNERDQWWENEIRNSPVVERDTTTPPPVVRRIVLPGKPFADPELKRQLDSLRTALENKEQIEEYLGTPFQAEVSDTLVEQELITVYPITKTITRDVKYKPILGKIFETRVAIPPPSFAFEVGVTHDFRLPVKFWYDNVSFGGIIGRHREPIWMLTYRTTF